MNKKEFNRKLIAILLGAVVSLLTELAKFYATGGAVDGSGAIGGAVTTLSYLKMTAKSLT